MVSKINKIIRDKRLRKRFFKTEQSYKMAKVIQCNQLLPFEIRYKNNLKFFKYHRGSISKMVNRCILTYRSRGIYRPFNLSRHEIRRLALDGLLPGVKKSSW
jgi:small subunit ribosomal protein S14